MIESHEKNIDRVIELTTGYKFLFECEREGSAIAAYEKGEKIKLVRMSATCAVEGVETINKKTLVSAALGSMTFATLSGLMSEKDQ